MEVTLSGDQKASLRRQLSVGLWVPEVVDWDGFKGGSCGEGGCDVDWERRERIHQVWSICGELCPLCLQPGLAPLWGSLTSAMKQRCRGVSLSPGVTLGLNRAPSKLNPGVRPHSFSPEGTELVTRKESEKVIEPGGRRKAIRTHGILQEGHRPAPLQGPQAAW